MKQPPAIIVIGYNRPQSLERLLLSLTRADYESKDVTLVISLDHCEDPLLSKAVRKVAESYDWLHGSKSVTVSDVNLGLRNHVIKCGDLSLIYGAIIILEDDLYVSKSFYSYAQQALEFFRSDRRIAGISLYTHHRNRFSKQPFYPLIDGYDNFFLQMASSWGQLWTAGQWGGFRKWYSKNIRVTEEDILPEEMINWPETSWAKYFNKYLVVNNKTFVYPRTSFSTNFSEKGVHYPKKTNIEQVPLVLEKFECKFGLLDESLAVYDAFFEVSTNILKEKFGVLEGYDFEMDISGLKDKRKIRKDYVLTSRAKCLGIKSFAEDMIPPELNIILENKGSVITLTHVENMRDSRGYEKKKPQNPYEKFSKTYSGTVAVRFTIRKVLETFFLRFKRSVGFKH